MEIRGRVKPDTRARVGFEVEVKKISVLNQVTHLLPFNSSSDISDIGLETLLSHRPLSLRNDSVGDIFSRTYATVTSDRIAKTRPRTLGEQDV